MAGSTGFFVGVSEASRALAGRVEQLARSEATVLIEGESGSGKGRVAEAIHRLGPRSEGPLVEVDLAALSPTLVEAELFGHEEGAFTDAHRSRLGRFRRAEGGTVVLDDVPCLPLELQSKLLRVLQERAVEPVGAEEAIPIDVRVLATSSLDLRGEVDAGRFREDLYYRLAVVPLRVPPLRARLADLPELVRSLGARLAPRLGVAPRELEPAALERLARHSWPGNVRELENALERVLALIPSSPDDPTGSAGPPPVAPEELDFLEETVRGVAEELTRTALAHGLTAAEMERALLEQALREQRGNVSAAARQVGLTRRAFEYRLARAGR